MNTATRETIQRHGYSRVLVELDQDGTITEAQSLELSGLFKEPNFQNEKVELGHEGTLSVAIGASQKRLTTDQPNPEGSPNFEPRLRLYPNLGLALGIVDEAGLEALEKSRVTVRIFEINPTSLVEPFDQLPGRRTTMLSPALHQLKIPTLWDLGLTGLGVLVGHMDSGIDATHPSLVGAVKSFVAYDLNGDLIASGEPYESDSTVSHGTHTAGIIVGRESELGNFGVAPGATLASAMVISGGDVVARMLAGFEWITTTNAKIVNGSIGLAGVNQSFEVIVKALRKRDILPIFAIGNEGAGISRYPGNYQGVLSVGACDANGRVAPLSGSQVFQGTENRIVPSIIAPGIKILSSSQGGKLKKLSGTSQAAPHVTGLCALLKEAMPTASANDLESAIKLSCSLNPAESIYRGNRGVPDALKAHSILTAGYMS
ncbi:MAG: S8 family serine peptidase [Hyphomonas sp.]